MNGERLAGGGVNEVVRIGATVRRPAGPHTPAVHALLGHLAGKGYPGAPRAHGFDDEGREILDFMPGEVAHYPLPGYVVADAGLTAAARLIRDLHDATEGFSTAPGAVWMLPPREPAEVICHGDLAPYNCVYVAERPVAFIDFDTAHPGPRVWDFAYAAYRFVPLTDPGGPEGSAETGEQARRLRVFADAYGLSAGDREVLAAAVVARLETMVAFMRGRAADGDAAFASHIEQGHDRLYLGDIDYIGAVAPVLTAALLAPDKP
ncbi:aminoglycoside phosphotransferase family protein [Phytomonospora sp. NPDC050363]|uniref:aminoglycoside phosphotransferase family protein n=1 Tax=Phytomonospora sp. NPDC050363 TaxID=3155642 RepID=UPI0033E572D5